MYLKSLLHKCSFHVKIWLVIYTSTNESKLMLLLIVVVVILLMLLLVL